MKTYHDICTRDAFEQLYRGMDIARKRRDEFLTPEHFLISLCNRVDFSTAIEGMGASCDEIRNSMYESINTLDTMPEDPFYVPKNSMQFTEMVENAEVHAEAACKPKIDVPMLLQALLELEESVAAYTLRKVIDGRVGELMCAMIGIPETDVDYTDDESDDDIEGDMSEGESEAAGPKADGWRKLVTCINDVLDSHNPLIGREAEMERTIQVLCRKDKNNPLHLGEPGVGKTALIYGLARLIEEGRVPERLRGAKIYRLDLGSFMAGTQYRGDFELKIETVMKGLEKEPNPIVYIDEIHNIVGAGAVNGSSLDASNMLKPWLEGGRIRFIGSTTYEEYNRNMAREKALMRRFQQVNVPEPTAEETIGILNQLKENYERFHGVVYADGVIEFAVRSSARHITGRFLPDKAIDLIDEAGAWRQLHPLVGAEIQTVDTDLVSEVLAKVCKVESLAVQADDEERLESLAERVGADIYGQDVAVAEVTQAVQMAKAGLTEEDKPLASLLFVGPTGVGKTEVARVLARELGIGLVRFDMSEYTEKHTVAKLIGSPAGYVGYDDGGLLTDAIRKTPNCVLLLDEIEKAHSDIYNILLQVMDYARLTDNRGNHADFRNVILIMTSNAGAQHASKARLGFASDATPGKAMLAEVKRTFKPEFLNRLSATVVFNEMDRRMARLILGKRIRRLRSMLDAKNVTLELSEDAENLLLDLGFTREYGARELDRVINSRLKTLLMREILFGSLKGGGEARVGVEESNLKLIW